MGRPVLALESQVIAITGGGSGLGRAVVDRAVAEGACVVVLELSEAKARSLEADYSSREVVVVNGDATTTSANESLVACALDNFGRLDTFIANAGLWDFMVTLDDLPADAIDAAFDEVFALNVKAPMIGAKASLGALRASRGSFIVTLSNAALFPGGGGVLYVASKHAGVGLVRQLAYELAPDVRVNGVAPGGMSTDLRGPAALGLDNRPFSDMPVDEIMENNTPLKRAPSPADYAGAYMLLASRRDGLMATGTVLDVCGGIGVRGGG